MCVLLQIDGNRPKDVIFGEISSLLSEVQKEKETRKSGKFAVVLECKFIYYKSYIFNKLHLFFFL